MDPLSSSCLSLNLQKDILTNAPRNDGRVSGELHNYAGSNKLKAVLPQIYASALAAAFHIVGGMGISYSAILIPQLMEAQNATGNVTETVKITKSDASWIASVMVLVMPMGAIAGGFLMDYVGRLNTIKIAALPMLAGWISMALATNLSMVIAGRLLTGAVIAAGANPALVYITEISNPSLRGSLVSLGQLYVALGMVLGYLEGWYLPWRVVAWTSVVYTIVATVILFVLPESPPWLISKGRMDEAEKSLEWFHGRAHSSNTDTPHFLIPQKEEIGKNGQHRRGNETKQKFRIFLSPSVYKPMLVLTGLFFFQQFSGIYVTLFYAVTFVKDAGTSIDPYLVSIFVGGMRFLMSIANTWLLRSFNRRSLLQISTIGMAICMVISGLFTQWIHEGKTTQNWVPVAMLLLYVLASMVGLLSIPWVFTAELFPLSVRGIAQSFACSIGTFIMFIAVQSYYDLDHLLGGSSGVQYFFGVVSLLGVIFCYVFVPETHRKTLKEIEEYFLAHGSYFSVKSAEKAVREAEGKV